MRATSGKRLVCGIGIYEPRVVCMTETLQTRKAYRMWNSMLQRSSAKYIEQRPSYAGTTVAPEFVRFADFYAWAIEQAGWDAEDAQLDKDLLSKGNRMYGPDQCVFLPLALNSLLTRRAAKRGDYPVGVTKGRGGRGFVARCRIDGVKTMLGVFNDPLAAFAAYKAGKEANIKRMAAQYKDRIDPRAYAALLAYQVEITD